MVEGARLESVYTFIAYRGFESPSVRQVVKSRTRLLGLFFTPTIQRQRKRKQRAEPSYFGRAIDDTQLEGGAAQRKCQGV